MKKVLSIALLAIALGGVLAACGSSSDDSGVEVSDTWSRVSAPGQTTGAVYGTLNSPGDNKLTGVGVPSDIAGKAEIHETTGGMDDDSMSDDSMGDDGSKSDDGSMDGGSEHAMMGMKPVSSIDLPAGEDVKLEPGGYHIMLFDLAKPVKAGDTIPVTFEFENGGQVEVDATTREG